MKKYFIQRGEFANQYSLMWADEASMRFLPEGSERITRREAEHLCAEENSRREYDQQFSGYASCFIYPAEFSADHNSSYDHVYTEQDGYIIEWREGMRDRFLQDNHIG